MFLLHRLSAHSIYPRNLYPAPICKRFLQFGTERERTHARARPSHYLQIFGLPLRVLFSICGAVYETCAFLCTPPGTPEPRNSGTPAVSLSNIQFWRRPPHPDERTRVTDSECELGFWFIRGASIINSDTAAFAPVGVNRKGDPLFQPFQLFPFRTICTPAL